MFTACIRLSNSGKIAAKPKASTPKPTVAHFVARTSFSSVVLFGRRSTTAVVASALNCELVLPMPAQKIMASNRPMIPTGRWSMMKLMKM